MPVQKADLTTVRSACKNIAPNDSLSRQAIVMGHMMRPLPTLTDMQVHVPKDLVALMSSLRKGSEPDKTDASKTIHRFEQPVPIASYLIAIVVGDLVSRSVSAVLL